MAVVDKSRIVPAYKVWKLSTTNLYTEFSLQTSQICSYDTLSWFRVLKFPRVKIRIRIRIRVRVRVRARARIRIRVKFKAKTLIGCLNGILIKGYRAAISETLTREGGGPGGVANRFFSNLYI